MDGLKFVGRRVPKKDAPLKATGGAIYIQDLKVPGMLYGKILYSKYPHAKIIRIDTGRAKALPGVKAILTGEDVPNNFKFGFLKDNPVLKTGKVLSTRDE
ncbi:MAG: xanthine dehydrogenase family protein molybdopterin-binding subunit, partial [Syntrophorhabdus sp.]